MADKLNKLTLKRNTVINRLKEAFDAGQDQQTDAKLKNYFLVRAERIDHVYDDFQSIQNQIIALIDDDDFLAHDKIRSDADRLYYSVKSIKAKLDEQLLDLKTSTASTSSGRKGNVRLPKINLPTFDGNFKVWPAFFDLFKSLIHDNEDLTNVEKFQYLIISLRGEPLSLVNKLPVSDSNYTIAYEILKKRYQNKRYLATGHYKELCNLSLPNKHSAKELRFLLDSFSENVTALKVLGFPVTEWDFLLFNMLLHKIDSQTKTDFEMAHSEIELPTYEQLSQFLERRCKAVEAVNLTETSSNSKAFLQKQAFNKFTKMSSPAFMTKPGVKNKYTPNCPICSENHAVYQCKSFLAKALHERVNIVKQKRLCENCLKLLHSSEQCNSSFSCKLCNERHHTLLHSKPAPAKAGSTPHAAVSQNNENVSQSLTVMTNTTPPTKVVVLLSTAIVDVQDIHGNFHKARILIDTASAVNFIAESFLNRLGLRRKRTHTVIEGLNNMSSSLCKGTAHCTIKPCFSTSPVFDFDAVITSKVCSAQPSTQLNPESWSYIRNLKLADDTFHRAGPVDMLIGAEVVPYILSSNRISGNANEPVALDTVFGWILMGKVESSLTNDAAPFVGHISASSNLESCIKRFWEVDNIQTPTKYSPDEVKCEEIFKQTVQRDAAGRFMVSLPFKQDVPHLGSTYDIALRRFKLLEARLSKNLALKESYSDFMRDYLKTKHMSLVSSSERQLDTAYYIPHHCVIKPDSTTTKLRVVFDASAKSTSGTSLNDNLLTGPKLQKDISQILLTFRYHSVVFICDIKQMYRQILVAPQHRKFQRIFWRFSIDEPVQEYMLNTVTYGVSSSPYLALRTLQELADREDKTFPSAAEVLRKHVYIDDVVTGSDSVVSAIQLKTELINLLKQGSFELRKWASNSKDVLSTVSSADSQMPINFDKEDPSFLKVLGLQWEPSSDSFSYSCKPLDRPLTKRTILSEIARIYDPLGFLTPCVLFAKCLMQQLWISKLDWDEKPSETHSLKWLTFRNELSLLSKVNIPRRIVGDRITRAEIHAFCDASQVGYSAVVYLRVETSSEAVKTSILCGKSRVAPLKTISIPRLELCAAVLLADLIVNVRDTLSDLIAIDAEYAWSDSQVALIWISSSPHKWKTFVANRVCHIQEKLPSTKWYHVPTLDNPADCASRGLTPAELIGHSLWWNGPSWLTKMPTHWPPQLPLLRSDDSDLEESKVCMHISEEISVPKFIMSQFSNFAKMQKVLSYVYRFINNARDKSARTSGSVTLRELEHSLTLLVKQAQTEGFPEIFEALRKKCLLPKPFRKLAVFLDDAGLLRVGGRLRNSQCSFEVKHPLLMPSSHILTDIIVDHYHKENLHPGYKTLHNLLLQRFWILAPRRAINRCLSKCLKCFRCNPKPVNPLMADLPSFRVSQLKPFSTVCLDYAGPFNIRLTKLRNAKTTKAYICLFVCCATRAVHLELASDLSSETFIAALRRFVSRRGRCSAIHSDQGTNFKGAFRLLQEYAQAAAQKLSISWHFNPPGAPHFNGLSEAGVKSVKTHFYRVVGEQILTYEEFYTLLTQIEALLNSRPLTAISTDPHDLQALTPGHFLTLEPLKGSVPDPDLGDLSLNRLNRWQLIQRMHAHFWKRWHQEYLHTLQQRNKWCNASENLQLNTLVLIKNELKPPLHWELARIVKLHPGEDGTVRVVTVQTTHGFLQRPVVKLCPLPLQQ